jgi:hypothetical protein
VGELWEDWMRHVDTVLDDPQNQIASHYEVFDRRPADSHLLVPSLDP